jgi:hypothetical protein
MVTLNFSPLVMVALVGGALIVLVLVAFFPDKGDNILRFCSALVDLYQRWQQIIRQAPRGAEVKQQRKAQAQSEQRIAQTVLRCNISPVSQEPSLPPLPGVVPQQEQNTRGE